MISGEGVTPDTGQWPPGSGGWSVSPAEINQGSVGTNQRPVCGPAANQRPGINHWSCEYLWRRSFTPSKDTVGVFGILSLKLNKILILHGSRLWKGWRDFSLMKTSQSTILGGAEFMIIFFWQRLNSNIFRESPNIHSVFGLRHLDYGWSVWIFPLLLSVYSLFSDSKYSRCWRPSDIRW